jgi:hypothetical protein
MAGWRLLTPALNVIGTPTLLIKLDTLESAEGKFLEFQLHLTDLTYLWKQQLEYRTIVQKALNDKTSIDPLSQFDKLIEHLKKGLEGEKGTKLELSSQKGRKQLRIHLEATLPAGLNNRTLDWDFDLIQVPAHVMSEEILLPLMGNLLEKNCMINSLLKKIEEKDSALDRIHEKLQVRGMGFPELFPEAVPSKLSRSSQDRALARKFPGLEKFDQSNWSSRLRSNEPLHLLQICEELFGSGLDCKSIRGSLSRGSWWEELDKGVDVREVSQNSISSFNRPKSNDQSQVRY